MVLYRTVGSSAANLGLEVGDTFTSAGFVSTSRSSLISADFANGTSTMFRISAPKGTRAIVTNEGEAEVILDHNVDFEIFDIIDVPEDTKMRELGIVNIVDIRPKA
jgi:hypothetical protein